MRPRSLQAYALMVAVLVLGIVIGAGATYAYVRRPTEVAAAQGQDSPRVRRERIEALSRELNLTDAQRAKVESILEASREERSKRMRAMYDACGQPVREHKRGVDAAIRAELLPEQQTRFDVLAEEQDKKFFHRYEGKPDGATEPQPKP